MKKHFIISFLVFGIAIYSQNLSLKDLKQLHDNPNFTNVIKQKGYKYLLTRNLGNGNDKIYIGKEKDTISIFFKNITWSAGINGKSTFQNLKFEATKTLKYDKTYSEAELGDESLIPIYSNCYSYFDKNGLEYSAVIFYTDKAKKKIRNYSFYIGESE